MRVALYCPNKPLSHAHPSGDLTIARSIREALEASGHKCREPVAFRARWFWQTPKGWLAAAKAFKSAFAAMHRYRPDLWLTYHTYYKSPDVIGPWLSRLFGIPYALFQPIYSTSRRRDSRTRMGFVLNRHALTAARHAFSNNFNDLEALRRILPPERITYIAPGIFPDAFVRDSASGQRVREAFGIPERRALLLTAARFRPDVKFESLRYLFQSLARLRETDFCLLVAGDGPMEAQLRGLAQSLLPGRVHFAGGIARERMADFYSAADLFVFPGIGESLGMVYLEAQSCGLPVVALRSTGVAQVVRHEETGLLVDCDAGEAMAEAIAALLADHRLRAAMSRQAAAHVRERHDLHRNYRGLIAALEAMADSGGKGYM